MAQEVVDIYDSDSFSEDSFDGDLDEYEGGRRSTPLQKKEFPSSEDIRPKSPSPARKQHETITVIKAEDILPPPAISTSLPVHVPTFISTPCKPCAMRTSEAEDDHSEEEEDDVSTEEDSNSEDDKSETSTIDALSKDPLFLVLSEYLSNDKGNIVDALFKINKSLKQIIKLMKK